MSADWLPDRRVGLGIALATYLFHRIAAVAGDVVNPIPGPVRPGARHDQYQ